MRKYLITIGSIVCFSVTNAVYAAEVPFIPPLEVTSGAIYNQQNQKAPLEPKLLSQGDILQEESNKPVSTLEDGDEKILVKNIKLKGDIPITLEEQQVLTQNYSNKECTIGEIKALAEKIAEYIRSKNYAIVNAYLPAQNIEEGSVEIDVIVGRYGEVNIDNKSKIKTEIIEMETSSIKTGEYILLSEIEQTVLILNDLSGITVKAALSATQKQGYSDLNLEVADNDHRTSYSLSGDNYGGYYTGSNEGAININWSNLSGYGDKASLRASSSGSGLWLGAVSYSKPLGRAGGSIGVSYSSVNYTLGKGYESIGATGIANVANLSYSVPLRRSRLNNQYFTVNLANAVLNDDNNFSNQNQAKTINRLVLGINGDISDNWNGGGVNTYQLSWTYGKASMDSAYSKMLDQYLGSEGIYNKLSYTVNRTQKLTDRMNFWLNVNGQWANSNLVSFEDMSLGGPYGVRAYPVGEATGDTGVVVNAELRWLLPMGKSFPGVLQLSPFYDYGRIKVNTNTTVNGETLPGLNDYELGGYGLGLTWSNPGKYYFNVSYAWKDGKHVDTAAPNRNGQLWVNFNITL